MRYIYTILNLECCKCARMRFHCANGLWLYCACATWREHWTASTVEKRLWRNGRCAKDGIRLIYWARPQQCRQPFWNWELLTGHRLMRRGGQFDARTCQGVKTCPCPGPVFAAPRDLNNGVGSLCSCFGMRNLIISTNFEKFQNNQVLKQTGKQTTNCQTCLWVVTAESSPAISEINLK